MEKPPNTWQAWKKTFNGDDDDDDDDAKIEQNQVKLSTKMAPKKEKRKPLVGFVEGGPYGCTCHQLCQLMELRGAEALVHLDLHYGTTDDLCTRLKTSMTDGISATPDDLRSRAAAFGSNSLSLKKPKSFVRLCWEALHDTTLIVLLLAAILSLVLSSYKPPTDKDGSEVTECSAGWLEGVAILLAVCVIILVTAVSDWSKEKQFRELQDRLETDHTVNTVRQGDQLQTPVRDLVVGDICLLKYGDLVPADGVVLQSHGLKIDESPLTGNSELVAKSQSTDPIVLSGTYVMEGSGKIVLTAVGSNSQVGIIYSLLGAKDDAKTDKDKNRKSKYAATSAVKKPSLEHVGKSVLQAKLTRLAIQIGYAGTVAAAITVVILAIRFSIETFAVYGLPWKVTYLQSYISFFILGVSLLVVAVPGGLPLAVTLTLAYSVKKMVHDKNLVRHLDACETMGNATAICSDKTGTLTTNRLAVVQSYIAGKLSKCPPSETNLPESLSDLIVQAISVNTAYTSNIVTAGASGEQAQQVGNKTDCALLAFVAELGGNYELHRAENPEDSLYKVYSFNSDRKAMSTVVQLDNGGYRLFTKGAAEIVFKKCSWYYGPSGSVHQLRPQDVAMTLQNVIEPMANEGLRTLCVAYKDLLPESVNSSDENIERLTVEPNWENEQHIVSNLTCLCIVGIEDPIRPEVPEAVSRCQQAGITVRLVTGDNVNTSRSVALKCGILRHDDDFLVLDGHEFNRKTHKSQDTEISQELMDKIWPRLKVLARSSPQDKHNLVGGIINSKLNRNRQIVAVTGHGTTDGAALKKADVGFAMGVAGTDVAKEASDIILTDDNFASIVKTVMWGRNVYDSVAKFLQFQLTVNVVAVGTVVISAISVTDSPLSAIQMLWVNLIMDTLASLALATELPTDELLERKPYKRTEALISRTMMKNIIGQAVYQIIIIFVLLFAGDRMLGLESGRGAALNSAPSEHFTFIFNTFVLMSLFNEINSRKIHGQRNIFKDLRQNYNFIGIWIATFVAQILIVQCGSRVFSTALLSFAEWLWSVFIGVSVLLWGQLLTSLPTKMLPKAIEVDGVTAAQLEEYDMESIGSARLESDMAQDIGHILWLRGLTRLHSQMRLVNAFRAWPDNKRTTSSLSNVRISPHPSHASLHTSSSSSSQDSMELAYIVNMVRKGSVAVDITQLTSRKSSLAVEGGRRESVALEGTGARRHSVAVGSSQVQGAGGSDNIELVQRRTSVCVEPRGIRRGSVQYNKLMQRGD